MSSYILPSDEEIKNQFQKPNTNKTSFSIPAAGTNIFICPPSSTATHKAVFCEIWKHENMGNGFFEVCLGKDKGCPICNGNNELWDYIKNGKNEKLKKDARELSYQIYGKNAYVYNVIDNLKVSGTDVFFASDNPADEPMIKSWLVSPKVHANIEQITAFSRSALFNPTCATLLHVSKKSNGTYKDGPLVGQPIMVTNLAPAANGVKLGAVLMNLLNNIPDLSQVYKHKSVEELTTVINNKLGAWRAEKNLTVVGMGGMVTTSAPAIHVAPMPPLGPQFGTATVAPPNVAPPNVTTVNIGGPVIPSVTLPPSMPANTSIEALEAELTKSKSS